MGIVEWLITVLGTILILSVGGSVAFALITRGDKKLKGKEIIRTRAPKTLQSFFLGFAILIFFGGAAGCIYCVITDESMTAGSVAIFVICTLLFAAIGLFGFLYISLNYVVSTDEGIEAHRLFRKTKFYRYEEIAYFKDTINLGMMGGLEGFDGGKKKIFAVEAMHIGVKVVADRLREKGVRQQMGAPKPIQ